MALSKEQIVEQSKTAYNQWAEQWRAHAKIHGAFKQIPFKEFQNIGVGKALLICANGYSLEENIEVIKNNQGKVDIMACDKTLGTLLDHGITPDYCVVCDANVDFKKYCEPWADKLQNTTLFINVCANTEWAAKGNWKKTIFFVNQDAIQSEVEFSALSGCKNFIPAATNVSGAMVVLATQSNNNGRNNYFGYDKILLIGFDYSWRVEGHYYAFNENGGGKFNYMKHILSNDRGGELCFTSQNLSFSAKWLTQYCQTFAVPIVNCSPHTLVGYGPIGDLATEMAFQYKIEDGPKVRKMLKQMNEAQLKLDVLRSNLMRIGQDHYQNYKCSI